MGKLIIRPPFIFAGALVISWYIQRRLRRRKENPAGLPLPPGPRGYPIIGNLFDFPASKPWLVYNEWFKIYGDMIYFKVFGKGFLILGSERRTYDLLEKRSSNYSDRPQMTRLKLMGYSYVMGMYPYGSWWRRHRHVFHDFFHPNEIRKYEHVQATASRTLLQNLLDSPEDFLNLIRLSFASTIMKIVYGLDVHRMKDSYISNVEGAIRGFTTEGNSQRHLVNLIPFMRHIPAWFPGAGWKRTAESFQAVNKQVAYAPFERVKEQVLAGENAPSMAATLIESLADRGGEFDREEEETIYRNTCAVAYFAGADTTVSSVKSFFIAMSLYPDVQKKAQAELDAVLQGRLPEFEDRPFLPYINAMVMETLRWQPVAPLGVPHMATNSDTYCGFFIPKGTIVIGNIWSMLHSLETYDNPDRYMPERFLTNDGKLKSGVINPSSIAFGFGRRICPGRFLSDGSLFSTIAHVLSVYDIKPEIGDGSDGREIQMTLSSIRDPQPLSCRITPRSKAAESLIRESQLIDWHRRRTGKSHFKFELIVDVLYYT